MSQLLHVRLNRAHTLLPEGRVSCWYTMSAGARSVVQGTCIQLLYTPTACQCNQLVKGHVSVGDLHGLGSLGDLDIPSRLGSTTATCLSGSWKHAAHGNSCYEPNSPVFRLYLGWKRGGVQQCVASHFSFHGTSPLAFLPLTAHVDPNVLWQGG